MKKIYDFFRKIFGIKKVEYVTAKEFYQFKGTVEFLIEGNEKLIEDVFKLTKEFSKLEKKLQNDSKTTNRKFRSYDDSIQELYEKNLICDKEILNLEKLSDYFEVKINNLEKNKPENEVKDYTELLLKKLQKKSFEVSEYLDNLIEKTEIKFNANFNWYENALGNLQNGYNELLGKFLKLKEETDNSKTIRILHENKS